MEAWRRGPGGASEGGGGGHGGRGDEGGRGVRRALGAPITSDALVLVLAEAEWLHEITYEIEAWGLCLRRIARSAILRQQRARQMAGR
jgi:hypothetical protein